MTTTARVLLSDELVKLCTVAITEAPPTSFIGIVNGIWHKEDQILYLGSIQSSQRAAILPLPFVPVGIFCKSSVDIQTAVDQIPAMDTPLFINGNVCYLMLQLLDDGTPNAVFVDHNYGKYDDEVSTEVISSQELERAWKSTMQVFSLNSSLSVDDQGQGTFPQCMQQLKEGKIAFSIVRKGKEDVQRACTSSCPMTVEELFADPVEEQEEVQEEVVKEKGKSKKGKGKGKKGKGAKKPKILSYEVPDLDFGGKKEEDISGCPLGLNILVNMSMGSAVHEIGFSSERPSSQMKHVTVRYVWYGEKGDLLKNILTGAVKKLSLLFDSLNQIVGEYNGCESLLFQPSGFSHPVICSIPSNVEEEESGRLLIHVNVLYVYFYQLNGEKNCIRCFS